MIKLKMMQKKIKNTNKYILGALLLAMVLMAGCSSDVQQNDVAQETAPVAEAPSQETETPTEVTDPTTGNLTVMDAADKVVSANAQEAEAPSQEPAPAPAEEEEQEVIKQDGKVVVDIIMFMGQSNMSGCGGDASQAPIVKPGAAYDFRAISDPTRLYSIAEPFGINENQVGGIVEYPGGKKGSLVSAFANTYYQETGVPMIAVSASAGATTTEYWTRQAIVYDFVERHQRAKIWLEAVYGKHG